MTSLEEPIPVPERQGPPIRKIGARRWFRENLFSNRFNSALTVVMGLILAWAVYRIARFVLVDARWEIIERNLTNLMVFHFDRGELWRVWAALFLLAAAAGLSKDAVSKAARLGAPATQSRLRDMAEVLNRIRGWAGSPEAAFAWYRSQPIPAFGDLTAEDLVKAGRAEALKRHLSQMAAGGYA